VAAEKELQAKTAEREKLQRIFAQTQKRIPDLKKELQVVTADEEKLEKQYQQYSSKCEVLKERSASAKSQNALLQAL
ncbi:hypothetical protein OFD18_39550, partial [Escherichia coli]|nr:hypothetical protein [Escherichia coli]